MIGLAPCLSSIIPFSSGVAALVAFELQLPYSRGIPSRSSLLPPGTILLVITLGAAPVDFVEVSVEEFEIGLFGTVEAAALARLSPF